MHSKHTHTHTHTHTITHDLPSHLGAPRPSWPGSDKHRISIQGDRVEGASGEVRADRTGQAVEKRRGTSMHSNGGLVQQVHA